jgi:phospholipase C
MLRAVAPAPKQVDHSVVLMLQNHSFDHMLGYLLLEGGRGGVDGPGFDHDHADAIGELLLTQRFAQSIDAEFRQAVDASPRSRYGPAGGADVD